jgi:uncharacterized protein YjbI with pentapeptide repeats
MTPEETVKPKQSRKPKEEQVKHLCHIHDKCDDDDRQSIHKSVCRDLETAKHTDEKHYCLLHQPAKEKDVNKFKQIIGERFNEVTEQVAIIEAELPEDVAKQNEVKSDRDIICYDFRYVWFVGYVNFNNYNFKASADFRRANFSLSLGFSSAAFCYSVDFGAATFGSVDFSSTTFSGSVDFRSAIFSSLTDFNSATFSGYADFRGTTFISDADFRWVTFSGDGDFQWATFRGDANFTSTTFGNDANFCWATIGGDANFISTNFSYGLDSIGGSAQFIFTNFGGSANFIFATFSSYAYFSSAIFCGFANFSSATFEEKSQTYFTDARFCSSVWFDKTVIEGYVEFEGNVFLNADSVKEIKKELETKLAKLQKKLAEREIKLSFFFEFIIEDGQEAVFEFRDVRLRNPERVSFNSMQLRPSWFVNLDEARKVAFNDVEWLNTEIDIDRIGLDSELKSLEERKIKRAERSLIKACNQLADNAEANRRFEEAKQFRKQSIALRKYPCHIHDAVQPHKKEDIREKVCGNFPVVNEDGGQYYCLWHNPDKNKAEIFLKEFKKRQDNKHTDFRAVVFPITVEYKGLPGAFDMGDYKYEIFWSTNIPYKNMKKMLILPYEINFTGATFQRSVVFDKAYIHSLNLSEAYFEEDAELKFKDSFCNGKINLDKSVFEGKLFINGLEGEFFNLPDNALSLKDARFDKPQNINFRSVRLRPHYFVDVDATKFTFHDCDWKDENGNELNINDEIAKCEKNKTLAQVCNQLAVNYEEARLFEDSSYFRYTAMEAKRLDNEGWRQYGNLYWFYKQTSEYGESWSWALGVLLALLIGFGVLFSLPFSTFDYGEQKTTKANDEVEQLIYQTASYGERYRSMTLQDGMVHSLSVATFQRPEPKAYGFWTKLLVALEVILAPLQAALLALAIRRKFMR